MARFMSNMCDWIFFLFSQQTQIKNNSTNVTMSQILTMHKFNKMSTQCLMFHLLLNRILSLITGQNKATFKTCILVGTVKTTCTNI